MIHACRPADLPFWAGGALYEIELGGAVVEEHILLRGQLDDASAQSGVEPPPGSAIDTRPALMGQVAAALLIAGLGFLNVAEAGWAHAIPAACVLGFVATGFAAAVSLDCDGRDDTPSTRQTTDP